jgi:hyperosmotically inducible protein
MRVLVFLIFVITSSGCSSLMLGGGSAASSAEEEQATALAEAADMATSNRVKQKFAADAELARHAIGVNTKAGMVTISGSVPSYGTRENAEKLAIATDGVKAVDNEITVE